MMMMMMMNIKNKVIGDLLVTGTAFKLISWENTNKSTSRGEKVFAIALEVFQVTTSMNVVSHNASTQFIHVG